ncbi:acyl-CoA dehydratase activase [Christensenellaceae bacterium OttesenSCG-928-M15]|nr:acyl-CoA dehydratase activase [Christensenellaceae bacterium OttesenSCG-928-M15]
MLYAGIDMGSTCTKVAVLDEQSRIMEYNLRPTGWDSVGTAQTIRRELSEKFESEEIRCVATGYGRVAVPYAQKTVTEITCHGKGANLLFGPSPSIVIDIGSQDTKVIVLENAKVRDFLMNDKCSAGTGRFLEIMANTLGVSLAGLCELAERGDGVTISSMCTVFAESEVISLIGKGTRKEDIAFGVIESIVNKVHSQAAKLLGPNKAVYLTGGLCELPFIVEQLSNKLSQEVKTSPMARYAGALGAALTASGL